MEKRTRTAELHAPVGYARISTAEQSLAPQIDALKAAGCGEVFKDCVSGAKMDRPGLDEALDHLRSGDTLAVWKLDRLGRSMGHLIDTFRGPDRRGVGFRSLTEGMDTATGGGTLVFHLFGALAQSERDLIRERTRAGLSAAAARGRQGGRKAVVTAERLARAKTLVERGLAVREAAARIKVGKTALYEAIGSGDTGSGPDRSICPKMPRDRRHTQSCGTKRSFMPIDLTLRLYSIRIPGN